MGYIGSHLHQIRQSGWGSQRLVFPGVNLIVLNARNEVLLGLREDLGGWVSPGGTMELGDDVTTSVHREVMEELGQKVKEMTFFGYASNPDKFNNDYANGDKTQPIMALFEVRLEGEPENVEEHSEIRFFPLSALPELKHKPTKHILDMYKSWKETGQVQVD